MSLAAAVQSWAVATPPAEVDSKRGGDPSTGLQPALAEGWGRAIDELLELRSLQDDWDGLGASAPSTELVDSALRLVLAIKDHLPPPHRVLPGPDGAVCFTWRSEETYMELEVTAPSCAEWVTIRDGKVVDQWTIPGRPG